MSLRLFALTALAATSALAKTDLQGCTYIDGVHTVPNRPDIYPYATRTWYVPDTGEICELLDCGGGRAPPKTDVPGCGNYKGTDTYSPRYMPSTTEAAAEPTEDAEASSQGPTTLLTTASPTKSEDEPESTAEDEDEETSASEEAEASETEEAEASETDDAEASETDDAEASETDDEVNASSTDDEGAEETGIPESGAAAMGVSVSGLVAAAVALGMF